MRTLPRWLVSAKRPVWHLDAVEGGGVHSIALRGLHINSILKIAAQTERVSDLLDARVKVVGRYMRALSGIQALQDHQHAAFPIAYTEPSQMKRSRLPLVAGSLVGDVHADKRWWRDPISNPRARVSRRAQQRERRTLLAFCREAPLLAQVPSTWW